MSYLIFIQLQQYSAEKSRLTHGSNPSHNVEVEDDLDTAVAEGSILAQAYSEKKRKLKEFSSPKGTSTPLSGHSDEAVDAVRKALSELNDLEQDQDVPNDLRDRLPIITKLLLVSVYFLPT